MEYFNTTLGIVSVSFALSCISFVAMYGYHLHAKRKILREFLKDNPERISEI